MSNMSYCRFRNTLEDLRDCHAHMNDKSLSDEEYKARKQLIELCEEITTEQEDEEEVD